MTFKRFSRGFGRGGRGGLGRRGRGEGFGRYGRDIRRGGGGVGHAALADKRRKLGIGGSLFPVFGLFAHGRLRADQQGRGERRQLQQLSLFKRAEDLVVNVCPIFHSSFLFPIS